MDARDLTAYVERDWAAAEALKHEHWAREFRKRGPAATVEVAQALWQPMRLVDPEWPSAQERREDFARHLTLKRAIDLAAGAFVGVAPR